MNLSRLRSSVSFWLLAATLLAALVATVYVITGHLAR